jgi:hypothetical protein
MNRFGWPLASAGTVPEQISQDFFCVSSGSVRATVCVNRLSSEKRFFDFQIFAIAHDAVAVVVWTAGGDAIGKF